MKSDFSQLPHFLAIIDKGLEPRLRPLTMMGEALEFAYHLLEHQFLLDDSDYEDPFIRAMDNPERYKAFNRTEIERTIGEAAYYGKIKIHDGQISVQGKGIELLHLHLREFVETANLFIQLKNSNQELPPGFDVSYRQHQLIGSGVIIASIKDLLWTCQNLILQVRKDLIERKLASFTDKVERKEYLFREKADLQKSKDQCGIVIYKGLTELIDIELEYHKNIEPSEDGLSELKPIIEKFLAQQDARLQNDELLRNLVNSDLEAFKKGLADMVMQVFSYHDISGNEPEKVYHALLIGLLMRLNSHYEIKSNREAGKGRFDIVLIPNLPYANGIIIEVKKKDEQKKGKEEQMLQDALQQIQNNMYYFELKSHGIKNYVSIAVVFCGKEMQIAYELRSIEE